MKRDGGFILLLLLPALSGISGSLGLSGALLATRRAVASEARRLEGEAAFFRVAAKAVEAIAASGSPEADSVFDPFWKAFPGLVLRDLSERCLEDPSLSAMASDAAETPGRPANSFPCRAPVNANLASREVLKAAALASGMEASAADRLASAILAARTTRELVPRDIEALAMAAAGGRSPSMLSSHIGAKSWLWALSRMAEGSRLALVYQGRPSADLSRIVSYELVEFQREDSR
ncbi:MAG: hypothetical protein JNG85_02055 [Spirochaetaceae bacterium]|nr:hypothetical protein [Spirochaetaceae bacterium]